MQAIFTAVGYAVWGPLGGAIGSILGGLLAGQPEIAGPRVSDLKAPQVQYGTKLMRLYGANRTAGSLAWYSEKRENESSSGGGCLEPEVTTFSSEIDVLYILSYDSSVIAVTRIWRNGELIWTAHQDSDATSVETSLSTSAWTSFAFLDGNDAQMPHPVIEASEGAGNAPAYLFRQCILFEGLQLGQSGQMPLMEFECITAGTETAGEILTAPLTTNASDTADDPASVSITRSDSGDPTGDITYTVSGAAVAPLGSTNISFTYSGTKLNPASAGYAGKRYTVEVYWSPFAYDGQYFSQYDGFDFLKVSAGTQQVSWSVINVSETETHVRSDNYDSGSNYIDHGVIGGSETRYAIVFDEDNARCHWYIGNTLVRTETRGRIGSNNVYLAQGWPGYYGVVSSTFRRLRVYLGGGGNTWSPGTVDLADIVRKEWDRVGDSTTDIDASALEGIPVRGFQTSGSVRASNEALAAIFHFGAAPPSPKLRYVLQGGAIVATLPFGDLAAGENEASDVAFDPERGNDGEVAEGRALTYPNYADDYANGTETASRGVTTSTIVSTAETNVVMIPAEAKAVTETWAAQAGIEKTTGQITLSDYWAPLEPTDRIAVPDEDGTVHQMRIKRTTYGGGVKQADLVLDDPTTLVAPGITFDGYTQALTVAVPSATEIILVDGPITRDADNDPGFYAFAKGQRRGATLYGSIDGVAYNPEATFTTEAVFGTCSTILGDWTNGRVFDERNSVTVDVGSGTLTSTTRAALLEDQSLNACAAGVHGRWEYLQFRDVELLSGNPNVYKLKGLLRGADGTEWASVDHVADESFVLMNSAARRAVKETSDLGVPWFYKGVSRGRALSTATAEVFADNGVGIKPLSPVSLRASRNSSAGIVLTWWRRTRFATRFTGVAGISAPLGEASEAYEVEIYEDDSFAAVARTITGLTGPTATYTAAQQLSDFGAVQTTLYVRAYQISASFGRGDPLEAEIDIAARPIQGLTDNTFFKGLITVAGGKFIATEVGTALSVSTSVTHEAGATGRDFVQVGTGVIPGQPSQALVAGEAGGLYVALPSGLPDQLGSWSFWLGAQGSPPASTGTEFGATDWPIAIAHNGSKFVVVAANNKAYYGTDGTTWTLAGTLSGAVFGSRTLTFDTINRVTNWSAARLYAIGSRWVFLWEDSVQYSTNANGQTGWTASTGLDPVPLGYTSIKALALAKGVNESILLASINGGSRYSFFRSTDDAASWTLIYSTTANSFTEVLRVNGAYVAIASGSEATTLRSNEPGTSWTSYANNLLSRQPQSIVSNGSVVVVVDVLPTQTYRVSSDGISFTDCTVS